MSLALAQLLLVSSLAFAGDSPASCEIADRNVVSQSASGVAQVSNLGLIQIRCRVAARPWPLKPGEFHNGLTAETTTYVISADGARSVVPSEVNVSGGGSDRSGSNQQEWVDFYISVPLDPTERDAEISLFIAKFDKSLADEHQPEEVRQQQQEQIRTFRKNPEILAPMISQYRVGRFQVECHVLDGDRVIGVGRVDLEVLFKGRFSDSVLPKE